MRTRQQPSRGPHRPMPSHALLPPDTHPHASALPPRCSTPFRAMPSCPGITLHGNAPLSLPGRRAHAEARTGTQTGAQAGAGPALRQYAAEQKIPPRIPVGTRRPTPPPDTSPPNSSPRISAGTQPPPHSFPDTLPRTHPPRNTHRPRNAHPRRPRRPALPLRPVDARAHKKAKHPCGCFASLWKRGVCYSPRAKRL